MPALKKNFAIYGRPPLGSYEYDFVRGLPPTRPPEFPRRKRTEAARAYDHLGSIENVSLNDFEAATRWMSNFAEQVKAVARTKKDALDSADLDAWSALWKRWLLFGSRKANILDAETKKAFDALLNEAFRLYKDFRRKGLGQVAIPYMSDLSVMLRTLPAELTLTQMVLRLREAAKAGDRLLDEDTAWWQWRMGTDTAGLRRAIAAARTLADKFEASAKLKGQGAPREKGSFAYDLFMQGVTRIPIEAAALYRIEETISFAGLRDEENLSKKTTYTLATLGLLAGVGYLGFKWWTKPQMNFVVGSLQPGYYSGVSEDVEDDEGDLNHDESI
jgi:hypothetical protein